MRRPWREGFPELTLLDDKPAEANGKPIPPMRYSPDVLVALENGRVDLDSAATIGDSEPFWRIYGFHDTRVVAWAPLPQHPRGGPAPVSEPAASEDDEAENMAQRLAGIAHLIRQNPNGYLRLLADSATIDKAAALIAAMHESFRSLLAIARAVAEAPVAKVEWDLGADAFLVFDGGPEDMRGCRWNAHMSAQLHGQTVRLVEVP